MHSNILDIYAAINSKQMQSASCFDCPWDSRLVDTTIGMHLYREGLPQDIETFYFISLLNLVHSFQFLYIQKIFIYFDLPGPGGCRIAII